MNIVTQQDKTTRRSPFKMIRDYLSASLYVNEELDKFRAEMIEDFKNPHRPGNRTFISG